jgi:hypothetical protein
LLSATTQRKDLDCQIQKMSPEMQLDLRFHAGFVATVSLENIAASAQTLSMFARVTPLNSPDRSLVLAEEIAAPAIDRRRGGEVDLPGEFVVGPGCYQVDWLVRDSTGRACTAHWQVEAKLRGDFADAPLAIAADSAGESPADPFQNTNPPKRKRDRSLSVRVLVNLSTGPSGVPAVSEGDGRALLAILHAVEREPLFGRFSVVAFSTDEQRVFYRQPPGPRIDFPALGKAAKTILRPGTVDIGQLADAKSDARFMLGLLEEGLNRNEPAPDLVIVVSSKVITDSRIPGEMLSTIAAPPCPVFYLNYVADPTANPWQGAMGAALKFYRALQYSITRPRDLTSALRAMALRMSQSTNH